MAKLNLAPFFIILVILPQFYSCQTLPPNVTNILNELLQQSLSNQQNITINDDSSNHSLQPSNLSEIIRIFVQFLIAIFNAFQKIFAESSMLSLRNENGIDNLNLKDLNIEFYNPDNENVSFEKILQNRKEKFQQIFDAVQRIKRDTNIDEMLNAKNIEILLENFVKSQSKNSDHMIRIKRNIEEFLNDQSIEKLLKNYSSIMNEN